MDFRLNFCHLGCAARPPSCALNLTIVCVWARSGKVKIEYAPKLAALLKGELTRLGIEFEPGAWDIKFDGQGDLDSLDCCGTLTVALEVAAPNMTLAALKTALEQAGAREGKY